LNKIPSKNKTIPFTWKRIFCTTY